MGDLEIANQVLCIPSKYDNLKTSSKTTKNNDSLKTNKIIKESSIKTIEVLKDDEINKT